MIATTRTDLPSFDELRWWMNTVRPVKTARLVDAESSEPMPGLQMHVALHKGITGYGHVETWWVVNSVTRSDAPSRLFARGRRYSGKSCEAKARADYRDAVLAAKGGA